MPQSGFTDAFSNMLVTSGFAPPFKASPLALLFVRSMILAFACASSAALRRFVSAGITPLAAPFTAFLSSAAFLESVQSWRVYSCISCA
ncbi:hypothetical protein BDW22DRAFT_1362278 [Trametopsis cervina]|nr:hypothetical protein BDW22DRAFT_1362278 [Trametopsis cervina]